MSCANPSCVEWREGARNLGCGRCFPGLSELDIWTMVRDELPCPPVAGHGNNCWFCGEKKIVHHGSGEATFDCGFLARQGEGIVSFCGRYSNPSREYLVRWGKKGKHLKEVAPGLYEVVGLPLEDQEKNS